MLHSGETPGEAPEATPAPAVPQPTVIPGADSLIGDLLDIDLGGPTPFQQQQMMSQIPAAAPAPGSGMDLLGEGLDNLVRVYNLFEL